MRENLISVIIPVYNTDEYLPRCLDSILNNTYRELEVICINDGSQDNSLEVLNGYAAKDSRVKVINQENAGVSAARNRGLDEATGEYIAFVDSDDWVHRQYFEVLHSNLLSWDAQISICGHVMISKLSDDPSISSEQISARPLSQVQLAEKDIPVWARLYRMECISSLRFDQSIMLAEDTVFNLTLIRRNPGLRLCRCDAPIYHYFTREGSLVHTLPDKKFAPLIRYYLGCIRTFGDRQVENICLLRACKTLFLWRYRTMFQTDPEGDAMLRQLLKQACTELRRADGLSFGNKAFYLVVAHVPFVYRLLRIANDPTMLKWEKQQRKKARAEKNKNHNH